MNEIFRLDQPLPAPGTTIFALPAGLATEVLMPTGVEFLRRALW